MSKNMARSSVFFSEKTAGYVYTYIYIYIYIYIEKKKKTVGKGGKGAWMDTGGRGL